MAVNEVVYLVLSRQRVERLTKRMPDLSRGEIVVKVNVKAADAVFREPTLIREIVITDPFDGLVPDVEFTQKFITEAEAQVIKDRRVQQMSEYLTDLGWAVSPPSPAEPTP